jgi:hypothetical protein
MLRKIPVLLLAAALTSALFGTKEGKKILLHDDAFVHPRVEDNQLTQVSSRPPVQPHTGPDLQAQCCTDGALGGVEENGQRNCGEEEHATLDNVKAIAPSPASGKKLALRIMMNHGSAGFGAYLMFVINQLLFAERHEPKMVPFVYFGPCTVNGHDHGASGQKNR